MTKIYSDTLIASEVLLPKVEINVFVTPILIHFWVAIILLYGYFLNLPKGTAGLWGLCFAQGAWPKGKAELKYSSASPLKAIYPGAWGRLEEGMSFLIGTKVSKGLVAVMGYNNIMDI